MEFISYVCIVRMRDMKNKTLFKVMFESGKTYYGLTTTPTIKSFIRTNVNLAKFHLENPNIHTITTFESLLLEEKFEVQILGVGPIEEMAHIKDTLVEGDTMCINSKKSVINKKKITKEVIKVPIKYSKVVRSSNGEIINYISATYAKLHQLGKFINQTQRHPIDNSFTRIIVGIERY